MSQSLLSRPVSWLLEAWGVSSKGSVRVNPKTALENAPIWYGINKISGNVGTLPLNLMRTLPNDGREHAMDNPVYGLMRYKPNRYQTPFVFKQSLTHHAILWGNGRAYIHRRKGVPVELIPLMPDRTVTGIVDGKKWHCTYLGVDNDCFLGCIDDLLEAVMDDAKNAVTIPDEDVLHIQGFGHGVCGMSLVDVARTSLEISIGADSRSAKQMVKGFAGKIMLEAPENSPYFRDQQKAQQFLEEFNKKHGVDGSADEVGLLREGVRANVLQMSNRDAEFIEQRKFQRQEAALWLMLETILGDDSSVSYNSEEQKQLAFVKNCLNNWTTRWKQECNAKLLDTRQLMSGSYTFEFDMSELLKADFATTASTLCQLIQHRVINPNEARARLNMNPYPGGDDYFNPAITPGGSQEQVQTLSDDTMAQRIQHMLKIEEKRVNRFLDRGDSLEHIDNWYESWVDRLGQVVEELGGNWQTAQNHCVRSLNYLQNRPESFDLSGSHELIMEEIKRDASV